MRQFGKKCKNVLATTSTKTKFAWVLVENDPDIDQISGILLRDYNCSQTKEAFLLVQIVACAGIVMSMV